MFMPAPGCTIATPPGHHQGQRGEEQEVRHGLAKHAPTVESRDMPDMPVTMVRKITGAMII